MAPDDTLTQVSNAQTLGFAVACVIGIVAMAIELRTGHIPNWLTLGGIVLGLATGGVELGRHIPSWYDHFVGFGVASLVVVLYRRDALGAGGVKLVMAVGTWTGAIGAGCVLGVLLATAGLAVLWKSPRWIASSPFTLAGAIIGYVVRAYVLHR